MDNDIERQKKLEADAVRDGLLRYAKSYEYHLATDSKRVRDLLGQHRRSPGSFSRCRTHDADRESPSQPGPASFRDGPR